MFGYDPYGKRVVKRNDPDPDSMNTGSAPTWEFDFYGITGQRLVSVACANEGWWPYGGWPWPTCNVTGQNVYFGKKLMVSNGVTVVTDRLGTVRGNTQGERFAYYTYGEERTSTVDGRDKFGTYFRDGAGQDYADQRFYNSGMGRFWSADTGGFARLRSPLSWNRYAYAGGDPVNNADTHGTDWELVCEGPWDDQTCSWQCPPDEDCAYNGEPPPIPQGLDGTGTATEEPVDIGVGGIAVSDWGWMGSAVSLLKWDFQKNGADCSGLFGAGLDPLDVLSNMVNNTGYGAISFSDKFSDGTPMIADAYTQPIGN